MALLPPDRRDFISGAAEDGDTINYDLWLGEVLAAATIAVLLLLHWLLHRLEAATAGSLHSAQLLAAALKETALLGLVSLFLFLAEAIDSDNKSEAVHQLEVVHISLWALAASYVVWVAMLVILSRRMTLRWQRLEAGLTDFSHFKNLKLEVSDIQRRLGVELDALVDEANVGSVRSYTRALVSNPMLALRYFRLLQDLRYLELRERFVLRHHLPQDFLFAQYLSLCKSHVFLRLANIPVASWAGGIWLIALDIYLRTIWPWYRDTIKSAELVVMIGATAILVATAARVKMQRIEFSIFHSEFARLQLDVSEVRKADSWQDVRRSLSFHAVNGDDGEGATIATIRQVMPRTDDAATGGTGEPTAIDSQGREVRRRQSHHYVNSGTLLESVPQQKLDKDAYKRRHREHLQEQRSLFWFRSPIFLLRLLQLVLFLVALDIALIVVFFSDITDTTASILWSFLVTAAAIVVAVYSASTIIPRYVLAIHVSDLVDVALLAEAMMAIEKEKRHKAREEELLARQAAREITVQRRRRQREAATKAARAKPREGKAQEEPVASAAATAAVEESKERESTAEPSHEGVAPGTLYPGSYLQLLQAQQAERAGTAAGDSQTAQSGLNPSAPVATAREPEDGAHYPSYGSNFDAGSIGTLGTVGAGASISSFDSFSAGLNDHVGTVSGRIARGESFTHQVYRQAPPAVQTHIRAATLRRQTGQRDGVEEAATRPVRHPSEKKSTATLDTGVVAAAPAVGRYYPSKAEVKEKVLLVMTSRRMQLAVTMAILLDFFLLATSASGWLEAPGRQIVFGFEIAVVVFVATELALRIWAIGFRSYFIKPAERLWNILDLLLVLAAVTGTVLGIVFSADGQLRTTGAPLYLAPLLSLRLLRSSFIFYVVKGPAKRRKGLAEKERDEKDKRFVVVDRKHRRKRAVAPAVADGSTEEPGAVATGEQDGATGASEGPRLDRPPLELVEGEEGGEEGGRSTVGARTSGVASVGRDTHTSRVLATDASGIKSSVSDRTPAQTVKIISFRRKGAVEERRYLEATGAAMAERELQAEEEREGRRSQPAKPVIPTPAAAEGRPKKAIASRGAALRTRSRLPEQWLQMQQLRPAAPGTDGAVVGGISTSTAPSPTGAPPTGAIAATSVPQPLRSPPVLVEVMSEDAHAQPLRAAGTGPPAESTEQAPARSALPLPVEEPAAPAPPPLRRLVSARRMASVSSLPSVTLAEYGIGTSERSQRLALIRRKRAQKRRERRLMQLREGASGQAAASSAAPIAGATAGAVAERSRDTEAEAEAAEAREISEEILADEEEEEELEEEQDMSDWEEEENDLDDLEDEEGEWVVEDEEVTRRGGTGR